MQSNTASASAVYRNEEMHAQRKGETARKWEQKQTEILINSVNVNRLCSRDN